MTTKEEERWKIFFAKMLKKLMLPKLNKLQRSLDKIRKDMATIHDIMRLQ